MTHLCSSRQHCTLMKMFEWQLLSNPICPCYPNRTRILSGNHDFQVSPISNSLGQAQNGFLDVRISGLEISQDLASGELATLLRAGWTLTAQRVSHKSLSVAHIWGPIPGIPDPESQRMAHILFASHAPPALRNPGCLGLR